MPDQVAQPLISLGKPIARLMAASDTYHLGLVLDVLRHRLWQRVDT